MRRKIVQQGHNTKVISLPMSWVRKYNLQKGDEVELTIEGDKLVVLPSHSNMPEESITLNSDDLSPYAWRCIFYLLKAGHNNIKVNGKRKDLEKIKHHILEKFPGFDILDDRPTYLTLRNISSEEVNYSLYERKSFLVTVEMMKNMLINCRKKQWGEIEDTISLEQMNNRLTNVCERYLNKKGEKNYAFKWINIWLLEKIADELKFIGQYVLAKKLQLSPSLLSYFEQILEVFEEYNDLQWKFDINQVFRLINNKGSFSEKGESLLRKLKKDELIILHRLMTINYHIFHSISNIVGINEGKLIQVE